MTRPQVEDFDLAARAGSPSLEADRISEANANIIKIIGNSGKYGVYVNNLATMTNQTRDEVVYRLKDLQNDGLVELLSLTDMNARLNEDVVKLLGANAGDFWPPI